VPCSVQVFTFIAKISKPGSHRFLKHQEDPERFAVVAVHKGETVPPGTLMTILHTAKITVEELKGNF